MPIVLFLVWSTLIGAGLLSATLQQGVTPVDYQAYQRAAAALAHGATPYQTPAQSLAIWRSYHHLKVRLRTAHARGTPRRARGGGLLARTQPGPYLYLPTLALLMCSTFAVFRRD